MEIYILRHGIAVARGLSSFAEKNRPLTVAGRKKMMRAARGIKTIIDNCGLDI